MSRVNPTIPEQEPPPLPPAVRNTMVGCLTFVVGFFGGGMIAVLLGKGVDMARRCVPPEGLPMCGDWALFAFGGGLIGAIFLPTMVLMKLRRSSAATRNSAQ
ncbi:MAG: hypothetical protein HOQ11_12330 [Gemmatimonadaceae bacterium]|nr:hypothetical protein [Gemmatimonadaceae bacterium]NUQ92393.1 hypothetical protein [Gemmatimonadaceae bacterium]NUR19320.1 hypothetical protein [Gemmatimonadaceae bacterium]NUS98182.1 hypothetical protein [Gemmatimonadaceae bacterium]